MSGVLHMPCGCPYPKIGDHAPCVHGISPDGPGEPLPDAAVTAMTRAELIGAIASIEIRPAKTAERAFVVADQMADAILRQIRVVHFHPEPACSAPLGDAMWSGDSSRVTCLPCLAAQAVAAEREDCAQLAEAHRATYSPPCAKPDCPAAPHRVGTAPFADVIRARTTP